MIEDVSTNAYRLWYSRGKECYYITSMLRGLRALWFCRYSVVWVVNNIDFRVRMLVMCLVIACLLIRDELRFRSIYTS